MKNKIFLILFLGIILSISLVSASGIEVLNNTIFSVNKTQGINQEIELTIKNQETFSFYNVSFEDNNIIEMEKIQELQSQEEKNITATIKTNQDFSGKIRITGFYYTELGELNETHEIRITYPEGVDICNIELVQGDYINWINEVEDEITIRNAGTGEDIKIMPKNTTHLSLFEIPEIVDYYVVRRGYIFSNVCRIVVLSTSGMVNNPSHDAEIDLDVKINYEPTQISTNFITTSYTINFQEQRDDIFTITNTGNKVAKNIHLGGDWFSFSDNSFDLQPSESKNIGYTITPIVLTTEETNKTYLRNITLSGNFNAINQNIEIFIPHKEISEDYANTSINEEIIKYLITKYCEDHPEEDICKREVIYQGNGTQNYFNYSMSQEQLDKFWDYLFEKYDEYSGSFDFLKEIVFLQEKNIEEVEGNITMIYEEIKNMREETEENSAIWTFLGIFFGFTVVCGILIFLIYNEKSIPKMKEIFRKEKKYGG